MHYKGPVDIMQALSQNKVTEDAVWPANSIWLSMGDTQHKIKYSKSIVSRSTYKSKGSYYLKILKC
jgi:Ca-activated chloride channel homolog